MLQLTRREFPWITAGAVAAAASARPRAARTPADSRVKGAKNGNYQLSTVNREL